MPAAVTRLPGTELTKQQDEGAELGVGSYEAEVLQLSQLLSTAD